MAAINACRVVMVFILAAVIIVAIGVLTVYPLVQAERESKRKAEEKRAIERTYGY